MQLAAKYKKPTIVARTNTEGFDRGSARGLNDSELKDFKKFLTDSGYFEYAQGHANAFGVSISDKNLHDFHLYANEALKNFDFGENYYDINFEREANSTDLNALIKEIGSADGWWGQGNNEPIIYVKNIRFNKSEVQVMGKNQDTVKIFKNGIAYMKFFAKDFIKELEGAPDSLVLNVIGRANLNEWGGRVTPQIFIEDYEILDGRLEF